MRALRILGSLLAAVAVVVACSSETASRVQRHDVYCPTDNDQAREYYNQANHLNEQEDYAAAEGNYLKAIELDPGYCDAMDNLGQLLRKQGRAQEAVLWYEKSLAVLPNNHVALQNLAVAYKVLNQLDDSMAAYEQLIQIAPDDPEGYYGLGTIYYDTGQMEKAIDNLSKAESMYLEAGSPYVADARFSLGSAYFAVQDCKQAKQFMEMVYSQMTDDPTVNYILGVCYLDSEPQDRDRARAYILKATKLGADVPIDVLKALGLD
jgi:tetratricopeptide (TPR) repeat protein